MKLLLVFLTMLMHQAPDGRQVFKVNNTVMGYTDRPVAVAAEALPPAFVAWMQWSGTGEELTTSADHVDPLLWTQWDQGEPYNNLCPEYEQGQRSVTGCVATAMAQVMAYWRYPGTYDWNQMLPNYNTLVGSNATYTQCYAVAQLMLDCGMAVDMDYGESSGANSHLVHAALASQFGYNPGARFVYRRFMNYAEWAETMRNELRAGRPIIYRGATSSSGHCFVIDGFNEDGFFHVNWGWGGTSDGWYRFTQFTPPGMGIGGSSSSDGYNYNQGMIVGLAPATQLSTPVSYTIQADSLGMYKNTQNGDSAVIYGYANYAAIDTIAGYLGLGLYQNDVLQRVVYKSKFTRPTDSSWNRKIRNVNIMDLNPGETYQLLVIWQDTIRSTDWQIVYSENHQPCGRTINATGQSSYTHSRIEGQGRPLCTGLQTGLMATDHIASITTVWTADTIEWTGWAVMALWNGVDYQTIAYSGMDLLPGRYDTLTLTTYKLSVPAGKYRLFQGYFVGNTIHWLPNNDSVMVESRETKTTLYPASPVIIEDTHLSSSNPILKVDMPVCMKSTVSDSAFYSGTASIGIYHADYESDKAFLLAPASYAPVILSGHDTLYLHFEGNVADYLPDGRYCVMLIHRPTSKTNFYVVTNSGYRYYFTIGSPSTAIDQTEQQSDSSRKELRNGQVIIIRDDREYDLLGRPLR